MLADPSIAKVVFTPPPLIALALSAHAPCLALRSRHFNLSHMSAISADVRTI